MIVCAITALTGGCSLIVTGPGDLIRLSEDAGREPDAGRDGGELSSMLTLMPEQAEYGQIVVGLTSEPIVFTARNDGMGATEALTVTFIGVSAGSFELVDDRCTGIALLAGETCVIAIAFAPESDGMLSAFLAVDPGNASAAQAELVGTGVVASLMVTPPTHDYGAMDDGLASAAQDFIVENVGDGDSGALTVELTGTDAAAFELTADTCMGTNLALGDICTISIVFHPRGAGERLATLEITGAGGVGGANLRGVSRGTLGADCIDNAHCQSDVCADGVCCDRACTGCEACNLAGSEGSCTDIPAGPASGRCVGACATDQCDGLGRCVPAVSGTVCEDGPCSNLGQRNRQWNGASSGTRTCNGSSLDCTTSIPCANSLVCDTTSGDCRTMCRTDNDCVLGTYCNGTQCLAAGTGSCGRDAQCLDSSFGGWGPMLCIGLTCQQCATHEDCSGGRVGAMFPGRCTAGDCGEGACTSSSQCTGLGWGELCVPVPGTSLSICGGCTTDADCDYEAAPHCLAYGTARKCGCDLATAAACGYGRTCVGTGAEAQCLTVPGFTCTDSTQCSSGSCVDGRCS